MKRVSVSVLLLQILALIAATIYLLHQFTIAIAAGAWFSDLGRLAAALAPYWVLPIAILFSFLLYRNASYRAATFLPFVLLIVAGLAGRIYLAIVPDPILDNFGPRPAPYPGFLVLPPESVPPGFQEISHHYTKQEYAVRFRKTSNDSRTVLDIFESPTTAFLYSNAIREFNYRGINGHIYAHSSERGKSTTLVWLNPPRQRISISLMRSPADGDGPAADDLIKILEDMTLVPAR
jgi:hypothetical protein